MSEPYRNALSIHPSCDCHLFTSNFSNVIDDIQSGCAVCAHCGIVLEQILTTSINFQQNSNNHNVNVITQDKIEKNNIKIAEVFIYNTCENMCLTENVTTTAVRYFQKLIKIPSPKKYSAKALAAYAIYASIEKTTVSSCNIDEIVAYTDISARKIKKIEANFKESKNDKDAATYNNNPTNLVNRYCQKLNLNFQATKEIEDFVSYWHDKCLSKSLCLVASGIYIYCKRHDLNITLKTIAKTCWVSTPSIYRFTKKYLSSVTNEHDEIKKDI